MGVMKFIGCLLPVISEKLSTKLSYHIVHNYMYIILSRRYLQARNYQGITRQYHPC